MMGSYTLGHMNELRLAGHALAAALRALDSSPFAPPHVEELEHGVYGGETGKPWVAGPGVISLIDHCLEVRAEVAQLDARLRHELEKVEQEVLAQAAPPVTQEAPDDRLVRGATGTRDGGARA